MVFSHYDGKRVRLHKAANSRPYGAFVDGQRPKCFLRLTVGVKSTYQAVCLLLQRRASGVLQVPAYKEPSLRLS